MTLQNNIKISMPNSDNCLCIGKCTRTINVYDKIGGLIEFIFYHKNSNVENGLINVFGYLVNKLISRHTYLIKGRSFPFLERPFPKLGRIISKVGRTISKVGRPISKLGRTISKLGRTISKLGRPISKLGRTISKVGRTISKVGRPISEVGRTISKVGRTISEVGRTIWTVRRINNLYFRFVKTHIYLYNCTLTRVGCFISGLFTNKDTYFRLYLTINYIMVKLKSLSALLTVKNNTYNYLLNEYMALVLPGIEPSTGMVVKHSN